MPWGLNLGSPWKVAPSDFLIPIQIFLIPIQICFQAHQAHIFEARRAVFSEKCIYLGLNMWCVKLLKSAPPQFQLYLLSEHQCLWNHVTQGVCT